MSIYITRVQLPTPQQRSRTINIYSDGTVTDITGKVAGEATAVPDHGRLIEADKLKVYMLNERYRYEKVVSLSDIDNAPTIIPEDRAERNEK